MVQSVVKPGYRPQAEDTNIETDVFEFSLLRQRTSAERLQMAIAHSQMARRLSLAGLTRLHETLSAPAFAQKVAQVFLGEDCPAGFIPGGNEMTWIQDSISLAATLNTIFERSNIPYYITGGVASAFHGEPRSTRDLDVVIQVPLPAIPALAAELEQQGFYVPGVDDALVGRMASLNITHQETIARADLLIAQDSEFDLLTFARRQTHTIPGVGNLCFISPEDIVLNKLLWGKRSQSDKQWRDVLGVLKVQQTALDRDYLHHWAAKLDVVDQLEQALLAAGLSE